VQLSWPWDPAVRRSLAKFSPDIIHAVTEGPIGLQGRAFAIEHSIPLVTSYHTDFPAYAERYIGRWAVNPAVRYLTWFHRPARLTQTPSHVVASTLESRGVGPVDVWGRSVDAAAFHPRLRSEVLRRSFDVGDRVLVLHVGRLALEKGVATLLDAFTRAHVELGDAAVFCVAGDGPMSSQVRAGLPFARHLGFLARSELACLYASSDLFVFPSATETCGLVALEAMASGLPVIAARAGGVIESVQPGLTGALIPPGEGEDFARAVVQLARDPAERGAMSVAARAFAAGRDWHVELDGVVETYAVLAGLRTADRAA
jgi:glycosyltransferase involved in cell wall biosynthesis